MEVEDWGGEVGEVVMAREVGFGGEEDFAVFGGSWDGEGGWGDEGENGGVDGGEAGGVEEHGAGAEGDRGGSRVAVGRAGVVLGAAADGDVVGDETG